MNNEQGKEDLISELQHLRQRIRQLESNDRKNPFSVGIPVKSIENEQRYFKIFEHMAEGYAVIEILFNQQGIPVDFIVQEINPAGEYQSSMVREKIIGKSANDIVPHIEPIWLQIFGNVVKTGKTKKFEEYSPSLDRWFEVCAYSLHNGKQCALIFINTSCRKEYELDLLKKEKEYLEIIDSHSAGSFIHDLEKGELYYSEEWKKRLGLHHYSPQQAALAYGTCVHPDDSARINNIYLDACAKENDKVKMEFRVKTRDAGYIWILCQTKIIYNHRHKPVKFLGTHMEITDQKNAQQLMRENELRLAEMVKERTQEIHNAYGQQEDILNSITDAFFVLDHQWQVSYWNPAAAKMYDLQDEDVLGRNYWEIFPKLIDSEFYDQYHFAMQENRPVSFEALGAYSGLWVEVLAHPSPKGISVYLHDVSERKQEENRLEQMVTLKTHELQVAKQHMEGILESIECMFFVLDKQWRYIYMNLQAQKQFAHLGPLIGKNIWEVFPDKVGSIFWEKYHEVMRNRHSLSFETEIRYTGSWVEVNVYPSGEGISVLAKDISERKLNEEKLRQSEERFCKIFNSNPDIIIIVRNRDNRYVDINPMFTYILEYTREEALGLTPLELNVWAGSKNDYETLFADISRFGRMEIYETDLRSKSGKIIHTLCSTELININGEDCRLSVMKDITYQKQMEKEIGRLSRLNLVGQMAAAIGHEIRNPMTTVRGFLQMLDGQEEVAPYWNYFELMIEEMDRANHILTNFLSLAGNRMVHLKPDCLSRIIHHIYPMINADAIMNDITVLLDLNDSDVLLLDEKEIRQLVLNLARNGLEAMDAGGVLTIRTSSYDDRVLLEIADEGAGIAPEIINNLGIPFQTTKDNGAGLGLSVCYSIAHRHNAKIEVETGSGGTTFFVIFNKS